MIDGVLFVHLLLLVCQGSGEAHARSLGGRHLQLAASIQTLQSQKTIRLDQPTVGGHVTAGLEATANRQHWAIRAASRFWPACQTTHTLTLSCGPGQAKRPAQVED